MIAVYSIVEVQCCMTLAADRRHFETSRDSSVEFPCEFKVFYKCWNIFPYPFRQPALSVVSGRPVAGDRPPAGRYLPCRAGP